MIVIYKLGNFKTGEIKETESKSAVETYVKLGFKLITIAWLSNKEYINRVIK